MAIENLPAIPIVEASQVAEARRTAARAAAAAELDQEAADRFALVVTEAATNLVKHSRAGGTIFLRRLPPKGIELVSVDRGPGMSSVERCLEDGYSTTGSPGTGLGAILRMSSTFDIYSAPGRGTVVLSQTRPPGTEPAPYLVGAIALPRRGETGCGDAWALRFDGCVLQLMLCDGLGHGEFAEQASRGALDAFENSPSALSAAEQVWEAHRGARSTRGAAAAVAHLGERLTYCGIGNIAGAVLHQDKVRHLVSHSGTIGHQVRKVQAFDYDFPEGALLVLNTDGLLSSWSLEAYPGLRTHHPTIIAAVLLRDFERGNDDATVIVAARSNRHG